ncbi:MAG: PAS domain-containing protein [Planctomycetota bacterium]|jgi:PAS domain S-box-containing protein
MDDKNKAKKQLLQEVVELRQQVADLQKGEPERGQKDEYINTKTKTLKDIMDSMIDGITLIDMQGKILFLNRAALEQHRYTENEVSGKTPGELFIAEEDIPKYQEAVRTFASGGKMELEEYSAKRKDGTGFTASVNLSVLRNAQGVPIAIVAVHRDITKLKEAEEERKRLICELQEALAKVKTLKGLIPICASCKKIRDDKGYWHQIEVYVRDHSEADFSHGCCPDCVKKLFPGISTNEE